MKRMKKIVSMMLAVIMVLGMSLTAFAAETTTTTPKGSGDFTITINKVAQDNHKFAAYQIFKGDLLEQNGEKVLSNIEWGDSVNKENLTALITALKGITIGEGTSATKPLDGLEVGSDTASQSTAAEVAEMLQGASADLAIAFADVMSTKNADGFLYLTTVSGTSGTPDEVETTIGNGTDTPTTEVTYTYKITGLNVGYYLVQELDATGGLVAGDAYSRNMLQVVSDVETAVKTETPTIEKKIIAGEDGTDRVDANNTGIGNVVAYELKGNVPDTTGYDYYFYVISDTLSEGLTFNDDVKVTVGGTEVTVGTDYYLYKGEAGTTFKVAFANIMNFAKDAEIVVTYSATVNENAVIGSTGNPNEVTLTYSNNPNHDYAGDQNSDKPGLPDSTKTVPTGETPKDITITYVAQIDVTKTFSNVTAGTSFDEAHRATFTLTGTSTKTVLKGETVYVEAGEGETATHYLLKNGTYTKDEPVVNEYMKEAEVGAAAGWVIAEEGYAGDDSKTVGENVYRPYKEGDSGQIYVLVESNADLYESEKIYKETSETTTHTTTYTVEMTGITDENGKLTFPGLGAGTYTLEETGVPAGYNKAENVTIVIECAVPETVADKTQTATWTVGADSTNGIALLEKTVVNGDQTVTIASANSGVYGATILNNRGSLLPSTGGIGTTIFYVIGSILVLGAVVLLVAKKRMSGEK
ncbi:MAG: isopeptide-forming domain-containing fimbrial protein [bacterium]|nr:isopeptide-forming domain-containing fimbrial protein [bacterium]